MESKILKEIVEEYELKNGMKIDLDYLTNISNEKKIEIKDLFRILGIYKANEYIDLKKAFAKNYYTICLNMEKKYNSEEKEIIEMCKGKDFITKTEVEQILSETKVSSNIIRDVLSINYKNYYLLIHDKIQKTRIVISNIYQKVFLLKMDFKYRNVNKFYTEKELVKKSQKIGISFEDFIKNLHSNIKHYPYYLLILKMNKKGLFIGKEHPMSNFYIEENELKLRSIINKTFSKYSMIYKMQSFKEDIEEDVFLDIVEKGGILEKNFSFDEGLLSGIITNKSKYFIWNQCKKIKKEQYYLNKYKSYFSTICQVEDEEEIDRILNVFNKDIYISILTNVKIYEDIIRMNRKYGYEIIAKKLKMDYDFLMCKVEEIQKIILENRLVKQCRNGKVIIMEETYDEF